MATNQLFTLLHNQHINQQQIDEEFKNIEDFLNNLVVFVNAAPVASDKGIFSIFLDGGGVVRLYVNGKIGGTASRKFKTIDNV